MPNGKTRRTLSFDTRSVMLFAALSMGGAALQAQTSSASASSAASTSSSTRLPSSPPGTSGSSSGTGLRASTGNSGNTGNTGSTGSGTQTAQSTINAAFARADANQDGKLSPAEAASFPAIGNRFKELDRDRDGSLSLQEFQAGASS